MARRRLPYIPGELQFITSSVYRRTPVSIPSVAAASLWMRWPTVAE